MAFEGYSSIVHNWQVHKSPVSVKPVVEWACRRIITSTTGSFAASSAFQVVLLDQKMQFLNLPENWVSSQLDLRADWLI